MVDVHGEAGLPDGSLRVVFAGASDRGLVRALNEDSFRASFPVFVVADGMGGHAFGDRASQAAAGVFEREFAGRTTVSAQDVLDTVRLANDAVVEVGTGSGALSGTTLTGLALVEGEPGSSLWMAFNIGDSRTYAWNGRTLTQLSVDHSAVQELVDLGSITRLQADVHPDRNVVTRALGAAAEVEADVWLFPVTGSQTFLLCSDGLTKELHDDEIAAIIGSAAAGEAARALVEAAVAAGGSDNVTAVVIESVALAAAGADEDTLDRDDLLADTRPRS